jgi:hypothetical protein
VDKRLRGKRLELRVPRVFSFIDQPNEALAFMGEFVKASRSGARQIFIDQEKSEAIDLCAGSLLNAFALEAAQRLRTNLGGRYPVASEPQEIVVATGAPKALGLALPHLVHFDTFPMRHGGTNRRSKLVPSTNEQVASDLCAYLVRCYADLAGYTLTNDGERRLLNLVGEVLANAEEHAPGHDWYLTGYLRKPGDKPFGDCHIAIFNFGPSLAETLRSLPPGPYRSDVEALVDHHKRWNFFGIVRPGWSEDGLWTLYALQEGVSRLNAPDTSRGVGTADMISEFQRLGGTADPNVQPKMCVVSGSTHILFDISRPMKLQKMENGPDRRVIAFNEPNNLLEPPDTGFVTQLNSPFPGTLISLRFYIDSRYLSAMESEA